ncbi:putative quinol monooxygenase [Oceaniglobus ichthyenteri]|uniref:putative quinol monooxygenase n=1 Tax=Oceaniglobus ichthyenteri TaxID=2136177 RepID=UPI000D3A5353|nr:putative quinol monooxygenase [Oceaniglobus ichthyenteri]
MTQSVHVVAVLTAKPGKRQAMLDAFAENLPAVLAEDGCITYVPTVDAPESGAPYGPETVVVIEEWASAAHLEAHRVAPHMQEFSAKIGDWVADKAVHILTAG